MSADLVRRRPGDTGRMLVLSKFDLGRVILAGRAQIPDEALEQVMGALRDCRALLNPVRHSERYNRVFSAYAMAEGARRGGGGAGVRQPRRPNPHPPSLGDGRDLPE